jgi:hypothetical protein
LRIKIRPIAANMPVITEEGTNSAAMPERVAASATWITPANITASKNASNDGSTSIAPKTITVRPAAGPLTDKGDFDNAPTKMPPTIPAITPEKSGAPDARATPRQSGSATRNTTIDAGKSARKVFNRGNDKLHLKSVPPPDWRGNLSVLTYLSGCAICFAVQQ